MDEKKLKALSHDRARQSSLFVPELTPQLVSIKKYRYVITGPLMQYLVTEPGMLHLDPD